MTLVVVALLLVISALVSGSEVAFFSLSPNPSSDLEQDDTNGAQRVLALMRSLTTTKDRVTSWERFWWSTTW